MKAQSWTSRLAGFALAAVAAGILATAPTTGSIAFAADENAAAAAAPADANAAAPAAEAAPVAEAPAPAEAAPAPAEEETKWAPDSGDTAWMLTSMALVLMMMIPGLGLFYGGMVRKKNLIGVMTQVFAITGLVTVLWMAVGYTMAFSTNPDEGMNKFVGGFSNMFLKSVKVDAPNALAGTIPEYVFMAFQMTFAIITPALVIGAFAERMKFSAVLLYMGLWLVFVYAPIAHWVWGGGFLGGLGVLDFAGGTVVHINAGISGLVAAIVLGKRKGFGHENMAPNNVLFTAIGAALLWVGWFGFNAGSAVGANNLAGLAMANTQIATGAAALAWMTIEWFDRKKPGLLGLASGAIAGLVAITPACGFVNPMGALIIGIASGLVCYAAAVWLKKALKYDDSLDVFGVHCVGGILGALLTGVLADPTVNSLAEGATLGKQVIGVAVTLVYSAVAGFIILMICKFTTGIRVTEEQEVEGLDLALHGETLHDH
jgi:Amt family ammonium transporter